MKTSLGVTLRGESYWVRCIIEDIFGNNPGRGVIIIGSDALLKTSLGVTLGGESYWVDAYLQIFGSHRERETCWVRCVIEDIFGSHRGRESYWVDALLKTSLGVTVGGNHIGSMRY